jgi:1-acyl-sn-glycerol-3-phosphate acyltransferase
MTTSSLAALAAIWCSAPSGGGGGGAAPPSEAAPAQTTNDDAKPAATTATAAATKKTTTVLTATAGPAPAASALPTTRRRVDRGPDGAELPPLTRLESALVAAFLTLWCGAPQLLALLALASVAALLAGQWRAFLGAWAFIALAFATTLIPTGVPGGGPSARVRSSRLVALVRRYFAYSTVCETQLDPDRPYLFASYPHGTYPLAPLLGMTVFRSASWHGKEFVGGAASSVFIVPLWAQGLRLIGCIPADRPRLLSALREGKSVGLCPGGISEMYKYAAGAGAPPSSGGGAGGSRGGGGGGGAADDDADPLFGATSAAVSRCEHAVLMERRGFVALAIEAGVDLVPCFYFGNSVLFAFGPPWLERLGRRLKVSLGVLVGQWGLPCPHRVPLMQAVGRPVPVPRGGPGGRPLVRGTPEFERAVDEVHAEYRKALEATYEKFRPAYGGGRLWAKRRLIIH